MLKILNKQSDIQDARDKMFTKRIDSSRGLHRLRFATFFALRFRREVPPVSTNKSWDVLNIVETIENVFPDKNIKIYDMGSYNCEIGVSLWLAGFRNIICADLNPLGRCIKWYGNNIDFRCEDFYTPSVPPGSLDVMTALSVIEHGYDQKKLLKSLSTFLKVGGIALLTTDYNEEKIAIDPNFRIFELSYMIFSKKEIESLVEEAKDYGLELITQAEWGKTETPIDFLNHKFSFILVGLKKVR